MAPPESLVLSENEFRPFKLQPGSGKSPAVASSGERLMLRDGGAAARRAFEDGALADGLAELLEPSAGSWKEWAASLDHVAVDAAATGPWLKEFRAWEVEVAERRAKREAEKAAAKAAEEVAKAAAGGAKTAAGEGASSGAENAAASAPAGGDGTA